MKKTNTNQFGMFKIPAPKRVKDADLDKPSFGFGLRLFEYIESKNIQFELFTIGDKDGFPHLISTDLIIELLYMAPENEMRRVYDTMMFIEFKQANIRRYLKFLASCYINTGGFRSSFDPFLLNEAQEVAKELQVPIYIAAAEEPREGKENGDGTIELDVENPFA